MEQRQLHPLLPMKVQAFSSSSICQGFSSPAGFHWPAEKSWLALCCPLMASVGTVLPTALGWSWWSLGLEPLWGVSRSKTSKVSRTSTTPFTVFLQIEKANSPNRVLFLTLKFTKALRRETLGHVLKMKEKPIWLTSACSLAWRISRDLVSWAHSSSAE